MEIEVTTTSLTIGGLPLQHAVRFEVDPDATAEEVAERMVRALEVHDASIKAQQDWGRSKLTPAQLAEVEEMERRAAEMQVQPRPGQKRTLQ